MICPNCSKEIKDSALFCGYCGYEINRKTQAQLVQNHNDSFSQQPKKIPKKISLKWLLIVCVVILILGFVFGYFIATIQLDEKSEIFPFSLLESKAYEDGADDKETEEDKKKESIVIESEAGEDYNDEHITIFTEDDELIMNEEHIDSCSIFIDEFSGYCILLELNNEGKSLFANATSNNIGKKFSIYVREKLISSPIVNEAITDGRLLISGMDEAVAEDLNKIINDIIK